MSLSTNESSENDDAGVRFVPLGGLGQIGMNCFALEQRGRVLVVDCGVLFPEDDVGVDVVHPDFTWLVQRADRIDGIFITHGHEDHIGALPHLLRQLEVSPPIYAPTHACALIGPRLQERELDPACLHEVACGRRYPVGPFSVEPVPVAHSIIDATALCIETEAGRILHTGDFDLDEGQPAGQPTDGQRLRQLGDEGIRLLLSDSTNVDREVRPGSEATVVEALRRVVQGAPRRVVVGLFSSNVHRLKALGRIAQDSGRRLCLLGRSLQRQSAAAQAIGRLDWPSDLLIAADALEEVPPSRLLVLAGGSQAEGPSSLRRLSLGTHHQLELGEGDTVVLSARVIPGNERPVLTMINDLLRRGVEVRWRQTDDDLHTSGHAGRSEQRQMIRWTRPKSFIPVHGTLHHLRRHRELAVAEGISDVLVVENGTPVFVPRDGPLRAERLIPHGLTRIAFGGEELDDRTRKRRLDLGRSGVAAVALVVDARGNLLQDAALTTYGIPAVDGDHRVHGLILSDVRSAVRSASRTSLPLEEVVRRAVRRTITECSGVRAIVEVNVIRAD